MSQIPAFAAFPSHLPPPLPPAPVVRARGPVGGPLYPYQPATFSTLYIWFAAIAGAHILALLPCVIAFPFQILTFPIFAAALTLESILLYKAWNQIQDGQQRTSPGKAVGYGFIPFFNFYWWFTAYQGLAEDLNAFSSKYGLSTPPVSIPLATTVCILGICKWLLFWCPGVGALLGIAEATTLIFFHQQVKVASMAIAQAKLTAAAQAGVALPVR